jgi:tetratricopeptide (TPR) repeat protein
MTVARYHAAMRLAALLCVALAVIVPARAGQASPAAEGRQVSARDQAREPAAGADALAAALVAARALVDGGRPADAVERLAVLDQAEPRVQLLTGVALYHADRRREAIALLEAVRPRLSDGSVERREAEQVLGLSLFLEGRFADAIPWLERTRAVVPDNLEVNFTLGQAYIQTSNAPAARAALAKTFGVPADSTAAHVVAAQLMIRLQMEALAEEELALALKRDPRTVRANFLLGQIALFRGQLEAAVERSTRELALNPSDAMASYQLGDALLRQNRGDEAIAALQRSLWLNPFYSGPYILLGRAYMKKGQPATAEGMLRRAIEYDPNNRAAHYLLAQLLQQQGREEEAKQEFAVAERLSTRGEE